MFIPQEERDGCIDRELLHAPMKLSEAMRLGAKIRPHATSGGGFDGVRSCAIVAAAEGAGLNVVSHPRLFRITEEAWKFLLDKGIVAETYAGSSLAGEILALNESGTREQVAEWLESKGL